MAGTISRPGRLRIVAATTIISALGPSELPLRRRKPYIWDVGCTDAGGLLERERELEALAELIRSAGEGVGAAALIEAEAGIGKTALLTAARTPP